MDRPKINGPIWLAVLIDLAAAGMAQSSPWPMISIGEANRISLSLTNRAPPARLPLAELQVQGYLAHKNPPPP